MNNEQKVIVVMPAYNAAKTLKKTLGDIPKDSYAEIILVDDASADDTAELAQKLGLSVVRHPVNKGYGGNQKTCYRVALEHGADIVVMLHPDYQYNPRMVPYLAGLIKENICDISLGTRIRTRQEALNGGMPAYKYFFNRILTLIENLILGLNLSEFHTGYRAFSRTALLTLNWQVNSDDFVFDQEILIQAAHAKLRIGEIPVPANYFPEASSISAMRSITYGVQTLFSLVKYMFHVLRIIPSATFMHKQKND